MIIGILVIVGATLLLLTVAGRLHARMVRARITHPASQPKPPDRPMSDVAELIHALGPEQSAHIELISDSPSFPERFRKFVLDDGKVDLSSLLEDFLTHVGYEVSPRRGDLLARRQDDLLLIRVLPWDGSFERVGTRTIDRFVSDLEASEASAGICITEAHVPDFERAGVFVVGRGRILRLLEALDGTLSLK